MCMDSTIPRKRLADMLLAIQRMEQTHGLRCVNVFHAGDGNLHPLILFDANDPDELHRCELFGADIMELSFSTPTPCSPVTVPPMATLVSRMSAPNSSQRCSSSGSLASNRISACRLPSA